MLAARGTRRFYELSRRIYGDPRDRFPDHNVDNLAIARLWASRPRARDEELAYSAEDAAAKVAEICNPLLGGTGAGAGPHAPHRQRRRRRHPHHPAQGGALLGAAGAGARPPRGALARPHQPERLPPAGAPGARGGPAAPHRVAGGDRDRVRVPLRQHHRRALHRAGRADHRGGHGGARRRLPGGVPVPPGPLSAGEGRAHERAGLPGRDPGGRRTLHQGRRLPARLLPGLQLPARGAGAARRRAGPGVPGRAR